MKTTKSLGIWMDHSSARLIEFTTDPMEATIIESAFTNDEKTSSLEKSENVMHNKEQHERAAYYKKIGEAIKHYDSVLLFGPTKAKTELHNILKEDHNFEKVKIETKQTDKLTDNQQFAFVKEYFSGR